MARYFSSLSRPIAALLFLAGSTAFAQTTAALSQVCDASTAAPSADRIAACTSLIESKTLEAHGLALAYMHRAWPESMGGQQDLALQDLNAAAKLDPASAYILSDRGFLHLRMGKPDLAIADYTAALKLNPRTVYALYGRGIAYSRKGRKAQGTADLDAARGLLSNVDSVFAALGVKP